MLDFIELLCVLAGLMYYYFDSRAKKQVFEGLDEEIAKEKEEWRRKMPDPSEYELLELKRKAEMNRSSHTTLSEWPPDPPSWHTDPSQPWDDENW